MCRSRSVAQPRQQQQQQQEQQGRSRCMRTGGRVAHKDWTHVLHIVHSWLPPDVEIRLLNGERAPTVVWCFTCRQSPLLLLPAPQACSLWMTGVAVWPVR